jgi:hypothetical protein
VIQTAVVRRPMCSTTGRRKPVRLPSAFDYSSRRWWVLALAFRGQVQDTGDYPRGCVVVNVPAVGPSRPHNGTPLIAVQTQFSLGNPMSTAITTSHDTSQHTASRTTTQPTNTPTTQLERSAAQRLRTTMAAALSYPWLSLRATRSRDYASGPWAVACRRTGRGCIRGRKERVAREPGVNQCSFAVGLINERGEQARDGDLLPS